ncbi:hypothetical protein LTR37_011240 [Vermiconidia calcicola]|uniref:Uncharacterized protein n=1 Tax=Vermiconidia calcicola TaxID=1690605 RepID=A0ACC3N2P2_9PEZI|nr:hypothetical protein LTR37_011240 [Vermiconidia calcicola]
MAPPPVFDLTSKMVSVHCRGSNETFSIHENLLKSHGFEEFGLMQPSRRANVGPAHVGLNYHHEGFKHFAHWMYERKLCDIADDEFEKPMRGLVAAHALGRKLECVEFCDRVIDAMIYRLQRKEAERVVSDGSFVEEWLEASPVNCPGRQLLLDWLVDGSHEEGDALMAKVDADLVDSNASFFTTLARQILVSQKKEDYLPLVNDIEVSTSFVCGFLERKAREDFPGLVVDDWMKDSCKYHLHTEVGQQCYKAAQEPAQDDR